MASAFPNGPSGAKGRKKAALLGRIRQQMEFYFSDANLDKDRFLQEKLNESADHYVPVSVFLTFNKLKALTNDETSICEAVKESPYLELSADGTNIRRALPPVDAGPADERTLYVENLPQHADHEWLKSKFSIFGPVQYVSLPKFKKQKTIKGFAFVEFDTAGAVQRACQFFAAPGIYDKEASLPEPPSSLSDKDFDEDELDEKHGQKRKREEDLDSQVVTPLTEATATVIVESVIIKPAKSLNSNVPKSGRKQEISAIPDSDLLPLKVMTKLSWVDLKTRYLEMQKASYRAIKQKLKMLSVGDEHSESNGAKDDDLEGGMESEEEEVREQQKLPVAKSITQVQFQAGVIVHLKLKKSVEDRRKLIQELRAVPHVVFVDVSTETDVYIRCDSLMGTLEVMEAVSKREEANLVQLLEGEEEKVYWERIRSEMDRKSTHHDKRRGKAKVIAKAERLSDKVARSEHFKSDRPGPVVKNIHIKFD